MKRVRREIQTGKIKTTNRQSKKTATFLRSHTRRVNSDTHTCTSCPCASLLTPWGRCGVGWRSQSCERWWPRCGTWPGLGSPRWGWWRSACCGPHCPSSGCGPYKLWTPAWLSVRWGEQSPKTHGGKKYSRDRRSGNSLWGKPEVSNRTFS